MTAAPRRRVLFMAEAVTLAHVARCVALAGTLDPAAVDVRLAADPRYRDVLGELPFGQLPIRTIPSGRFCTALARGTPIYRLADLAGYVAEDLAVLDAVRPDVVVGDFRLSLAVSARLAGIRYVTVTNAHWSPHARVRPPVPELPLTRALGVPLAQRVFDAAGPAAGWWHARPMRQLRRRYGLPPARLDVRDAYTEADLTLYADLPDLVPMADLPGHHRFLGPVAWSPPVPLPPWWDGLRADRPVVYVNLGSSGPPALLPRVLTALADLPVQVVAATAGRPRPPAIPPNAQLADLLPGDAAARRASLVIGNGGSLSGYQALAAGRPVLGICTNLDQYLNMTGIQRAGAGWLLRSGRLSAAALRQAVRDALADDRALARAAELAAAIAGWPTAERFAAALAPAVAGPVGHH